MQQTAPQCQSDAIVGSVLGLSTEPELSVMYVYSTIHEELEYRKAFARWIPRWLTKEKKIDV
jgi:hypothetical protein